MTNEVVIRTTGDALKALAAIKYWEDRLNKWKKEARAVIEENSNEGDRLVGYGPDELADIVTVTRSKPRRDKFAVTNEGVFVTWLEKEHPDLAKCHVMKTLGPRSQFRKSEFLEGFIESHGGELPPGVGEAKVATSSLRVTQTEEQKENLLSVIGQIQAGLGLLEGGSNE